MYVQWLSITTPPSPQLASRLHVLITERVCRSQPRDVASAIPADAYASLLRRLLYFASRSQFHQGTTAAAKATLASAAIAAFAFAVRAGLRGGRAAEVRFCFVINYIHDVWCFVCVI